MNKLIQLNLKSVHNNSVPYFPKLFLTTLGQCWVIKQKKIAYIK